MPVVDASVVVDWVAPGVNPGQPAGRLLATWGSRQETVTAPRLLVEEVGNALLAGIRRRRWSSAEADDAFLLLRRLPVALIDVPSDVDRAWELARRFDEHPLYDMVYVATAERTGQVLHTADATLAQRLHHLPFVELVR